MKILSLHCDYIKFKALKKALKEPEQLSKEEQKEHEIKECLVILTSVEKGDNSETIKKLVENIGDISKQVNCKNIVLYPYAHLSSQLASPNLAVSALKETENILKKKFSVTRAPFGYYKEFELKCKGHPLSELSRDISSEATGKEIGKLTSKKGKTEIIVSKEEIVQLAKKLSKTNMQTIRGKNNLKSNVELGKELDLYTVNEVVGHGLPLLTPKGATIKRILERFAVDEEIKRGYEHTSTPIMAKADLYKISGHWQHYKDSMFVLNINGEDYALRPMTCPFQFVLYKRKSRSYKDLPKKYAEIATLYRQEQSGELRGLTRLWQFTLSDAHIICTPEQLENQFAEVLDLVNFMMKFLGIKDVWYRFSKWDPKNKEKYIDNPKAWEESQKIMKKILDKLKIKYIETENEAAFYGPKLDLQYEDIYGKEDTLITIQIDFALPERYDLTYLDKDNIEKRPMIIHRSSIGCTERTMAYILEKTQGNLPIWLAPFQVRVISFTDRNVKACKELEKELKEQGIRVDTDLKDETVQNKVRNAELQKIQFIILIGNKEEENKTLAVRHNGKVEYNIKSSEFIKKLKKLIEERI